MFEDYIDALCKAFGQEERILVWDICNEPMAYNGEFPAMETVRQYELAWLHKIADRMRANEVSQPLGIGSRGNEPMEVFGDACDVYLTHLYYVGGDTDKFEAKVLRFVEESKKNNKPFIKTITLDFNVKLMSLIDSAMKSAKTGKKEKVK